MTRTPFALALALALTAAPAAAQRAPAPPAAPRVYVVQPGDTILRIANRLGVDARDLAARNSIPRPYTLNVGQRLRIPPGARPEVVATLPTREEASGGVPGSPGAASHRAGFVTMARARDGAELATNFAAAAPNLRVRVERFLRARDNRQHMVHPRLVRTLQMLSDRFGGRRIVVLSGYRPARAGVAVSRHSLGQAVDLRVEDVPLRDVWQWCQTQRNLGCGLSLRSNYVHVDVRTAPEAWQLDGRRRGPRAEVRMLDPDPDEDPAVVVADAAPSQDDPR